jgi:hypothetical protein
MFKNSKKKFARIPNLSVSNGRDNKKQASAIFGLNEALLGKIQIIAGKCRVTKRFPFRFRWLIQTQFMCKLIGHQKIISLEKNPNLKIF